MSLFQNKVTITGFKTSFVILVFVFVLSSCANKIQKINFYLEKDDPQITYALKNANQLFNSDIIDKTNDVKDANVVVKIDDENQFTNLKEEGFVIKKNAQDKIEIIGKDAIGAMYGILDITEQLSFGKGLLQIKDKTVNPSFKNRFIKFNLPWSSYRKGKVISQHTETCRDTLFWKSYLDMMVVNRLNVLSLWNLHPFSDMVKLDKYPEASTLSEDEFKERKKFWKSLFLMAKKRGIQTYIVNWNIFIPEALADAHNIEGYKMRGKHWGQGFTSELIEDYTRESVKQVINQYPNLTGIGITLGEGMGGMTAPERKDWINRTILEGMKQANRKIKLLYRAPLSAGTSSVGDTSKKTEEITREILDTLKIASETTISFKYNWSHAHSSDKLFKVHGGKLTDTYWNPSPENYSIVWTMRNEDFFIHRWAYPDFVRRFSKNNLNQSAMTGCIIGSECYIPAKDYFSNEIGQKLFKYAYERQWLWYSIWGRLLYDANTKDDLFAQQINKKFNINYGDELLKTWETASSFYHHFASFYRGSWDAALYSEAFTSIMRGPNVDAKNKVDIITMKALGNRPVLDSINYINISDYVKNKNGIIEQKITPVKLVTILKDNAAKIFKNLEDFKKQNPSETLKIELCDIEVLANLQLFFAERIEATLLLAEHLLLDEKINQKEIKAHLNSSIKYWKTIIELKERYNKRHIPYVFNQNLDYHQYLQTLEKERDSFQNIKEFWIHNVR